MSAFRYGLPFAGFNSTIDRHMLPRNMVSGATAVADLADTTKVSKDWALDPVEGKWVRRGGSAILGDSTP